jgi:NADH-quinone oxidoreductase subunit F
VLGRAFCALGDGATSPVTSSIQYFKQDYVDYIEGRTPPRLRSADLVGAH